jgi:hypothetical protein
MRRRLEASTFADASVLLGKELRTGLKAGLTLAFDARDARGHLATSYVVVLPSGAVAVVRLGRWVSLRTVYFPDPGLRRKSREARRGVSITGIHLIRPVGRCILLSG